MQSIGQSDAGARNSAQTSTGADAGARISARESSGPDLPAAETGAQNYSDSAQQNAIEASQLEAGARISARASIRPDSTQAEGGARRSARSSLQRDSVGAKQADAGARISAQRSAGADAGAQISGRASGGSDSAAAETGAQNSPSDSTQQNAIEVSQPDAGARMSARSGRNFTQQDAVGAGLQEVVAPSFARASASTRSSTRNSTQPNVMGVGQSDGRARSSARASIGPDSTAAQLGARRSARNSQQDGVGAGQQEVGAQSSAQISTGAGGSTIGAMPDANPAKASEGISIQRDPIGIGQLENGAQSYSGTSPEPDAIPSDANVRTSARLSTEPKVKDGEATIHREGSKEQHLTASKADHVFTAEDDVEELGLLTDGEPPGPVIASEVKAGGWAKGVGIHARDEILEINDVRIADLTMDDIKASLDKRPLKLLVRGTPELTEEDQIEAVANEEDTILGVTFVPMPPEPVFAKKVRAGSWAQKAGIVPGSEILSVNENDVEGMQKSVFLELLRQRPLKIVFIHPVTPWSNFEEAKANSQEAQAKDPKEAELEQREAKLFRRERIFNAGVLAREQELREKKERLQKREDELKIMEEEQKERLNRREQELQVMEEEQEERLNQREQELQVMEERLKELEAKLNERGVELEDEFNHLNDDFNQRSKQLDQREHSLQELQDELEPRQDELKQREEDLGGIGEKLKEQKQKLKERGKVLDDREQEMLEHEQELTERETACGLAEEVARKREEDEAFKAAMVANNEEECEEAWVEWTVKVDEEVDDLGFISVQHIGDNWAYVRKIVVDRWADKAGLHEGDILVAIDGHDVSGMESNARVLKALEKRPLKLTFARDENKHYQDEQPPDKAFDCVADYEDKPLGFTPTNFPPGRIHVEQVSSSGWAARNGIQKGAEIILVNGARASKLPEHIFKSQMRSRPLQLRVKPITTDEVEPDEQLERISLDELSRPLGLVLADMLPWKLAVEDVIEQSWAEKSGIERYSEIRSVNDRDLMEFTLLDVKKALRVQPLKLTLQLPKVSGIREVSAEKHDTDLGCHIKFDDDLGLITSDGMVQSVFIDMIYKGCWAQKHGIKAGSEVLAVNSKNVNTMTLPQIKETFLKIRPLRIKVKPPMGSKTNFDHDRDLEKVNSQAMDTMKANMKKMGAGAGLRKRNISLEEDLAAIAEDTDDSSGHGGNSDDTDGDQGLANVLGRTPKDADHPEEVQESHEEESEDEAIVEIYLKCAPHPDVIKARAEQEERARKKELQAYIERIRESEEQIFKYFDEDKLGSVSHKEFHLALNSLNVHLDDQAFRIMMEELDPYETGQIPYEGFHSRVGIHRWAQGGRSGRSGHGGQGGAVSEAQKDLDEKTQKEQEEEKAEMKEFKSMDEDEDGKLSYDELRKVHKEMSDVEFADMMQSIDMDGDGSITINEYLNRHLALQEQAFRKQMEEAQQEFRDREGEYFRSQDVDGSGRLTYNELRGQRRDMSDAEFQVMWDELDHDRSGFVTRAEWILFQEGELDKEQAAQEEAVLQSFHEMDIDKSGKLSESEIRAMHTDMNDHEFKRMMRKMDRDGDGNVSKVEYLKLQELERKQQAMEQRHEELKDKELAYFAVGDTDQSGRITYEECRAMHPEKTEQEFQLLWRRIDKDADGSISKEEWLSQFRLSEEERKHRKALEDLILELELREKELFTRLDVDESGQLSHEELHHGLFPQMDVEKFLETLEKHQLDREFKGYVTLTEYLDRYGALDVQEKEPLLDRLRQLGPIERDYFLSFDLDESGRVSIEEMREWFPDMVDGEFAEMIRKIDREGDGLITVQEYLCRHVVDESTLEERLLTEHRFCIMAACNEREALMGELEKDLQQRQEEVGLLFMELRTQFKTRSDAADRRDREFEESARKREEDMWVQLQIDRENVAEELQRCKEQCRERERRVQNREEEVLQFISDVFRTFDADDTGTLTYNEFKHAVMRLGWELSDDELFAMMRELDEDGDGAINYREFINLYALKRHEQEQQEGAEQELEDGDKDVHNNRILNQEWQRQEYHLRRVEEAKLQLEQQRKKDEYERRLQSEAEALSTVLRLAMEHFVNLGAAVASVASELGSDLQYQLLHLVLEQAVPCASYHSGVKGLCSDLESLCESLDSKSISIAQVPIESSAAAGASRRQTQELAKTPSEQIDGATIHAEAIWRIAKQIDDGTTLICIADDDDDAAEVFASLQSHDIIGMISAGETVEAAGKPVDVDGYVTVPIKPEGAVQLDLFDVYEAYEIQTERVFISVEDDSWAQSQHLAEGDELLAINGQAVSKMTGKQLQMLMRKRPLQLSFFREGGWDVDSVVRTEHAGSTSDDIHVKTITVADEVETLGFGLSGLPPERALITVKDGGWAQSQHLAEGDELLAIDSQDVSKMTGKQLKKLMGKRPLQLRFFREGGWDVDSAVRAEHAGPRLPSVVEFGEEAEENHEAHEASDGIHVKTLTVTKEVKMLGFGLSGMPPERAFISVEEGGWAESQDLAEGDELLAINGQDLSKMTGKQLKKLMRKRPLELRFFREGGWDVVSAVRAEHAGSTSDDIHVKTIAVTQEVETLGFGLSGLPPERALITVKDGGWAQSQDLVEGDELQAINSQDVSKLTGKQLKKLMGKRPLQLRFFREGGWDVDSAVRAEHAGPRLPSVVEFGEEAEQNYEAHETSTSDDIHVKTITVAEEIETLGFGLLGLPPERACIGDGGWAGSQLLTEGDELLAIDGQAESKLANKDELSTGQIDDGIILTCVHSDVVEVFASPQSHDIIGMISPGQRVEASGQPTEVDGFEYVPIKPEGAVQLDVFQECEAHELSDTQVTGGAVQLDRFEKYDTHEGEAHEVSDTQATGGAVRLDLFERYKAQDLTDTQATSTSPMRRSLLRVSLAQGEVAVDSIYSTKLTAVDIIGGAFAAVLTNGSVVTWGHKSEGGNCSNVAEDLSHGVRRIYATAHAFAAMKEDGSVVTWGSPLSGGEPGAARPFILSDVQAVYSTDSAFAALKIDGSLCTWGNTSSGGDSSTVRDHIRGGVKSVFSTSQAFAALKLDGSVCTWGHPQFGGDSRAAAEDLDMNVSRIYSTTSVFAAVKFFGSVHTWGSPTGGADMSLVRQDLSSQVQQVFSTVNAFAALKRDGSVVTWGHLEFGGDSEDARRHLKSVKRIYATDGAFAALRKGGIVNTWGARLYGGDSSAVRHHLLKGVEGVYSTSRAFAAIKSDGSVHTWGSQQAGGDSSMLRRELKKGVKQVYSTTRAFAVVKTSGSVFTWGSAAAGGDSTAVREHLASGVQRIYATAQAFAAVLQDGSVQTWGSPDFGGDSSAVKAFLGSMLRNAQPKRLRQPGVRGSIIRKSSLLREAAQPSLRAGSSALGEDTWAGEPVRPIVTGVDVDAARVEDAAGTEAVSPALCENAGAESEMEPPNIIY